MAYISVDMKDLNEWDQKTDTLFIFLCRKKKQVVCRYFCLSSDIDTQENTKIKQKTTQKNPVFHISFRCTVCGYQILWKKCPALTKIHTSNHRHAVLRLYRMSLQGS